MRCRKWVMRRGSVLGSELCPDHPSTSCEALCSRSPQQPATSLAEPGAPARLPLAGWLPLLFAKVLLREVRCVCSPTAECPEWARVTQISITTPQHYLFYMLHPYIAASVRRNNLYCPCLPCSLPFPVGCELAWFITGRSISGSWDYFSQHHVSPYLIIFLRLPKRRDTTLP